MYFQGIIPRDVHLLPGKLKDVHQARDDVHNTPPPLPSVNRPMTIPRPQTMPDVPQDFNSHFTPEVQRNDVRTHSSGDVSSAFGAEVDNLRQLRERQHDLMFKSLDSSAPTSPSSQYPTMTPPPNSSSTFRPFNRNGSRDDVNLQQHVTSPRFNPSQAWEVESLHGRDDRSNGESGFEEDFSVDGRVHVPTHRVALARR